MVINEAVISALAALTGSAVGGLTPIISNYLIQRGLTQRELLTHELVERQNLYAEFIRFGTTLYVSATTKQPQDENLDDLVKLYALVGRIQLYPNAKDRVIVFSLVFKFPPDDSGTRLPDQNESSRGVCRLPVA